MLYGDDKDYALNTITRFYELEKSDMSNSPQVYQNNSVTVYGMQYKPGANSFLLDWLWMREVYHSLVNCPEFDCALQ